MWWGVGREVKCIGVWEERWNVVGCGKRDGMWWGVGREVKCIGCGKRDGMLWGVGREMECGGVWEGR